MRLSEGLLPGSGGGLVGRPRRLGGHLAVGRQRREAVRCRTDGRVAGRFYSGTLCKQIISILATSYFQHLISNCKVSKLTL